MQLEENKMLNEFVDTQHLSWDDDMEFIRKLCSQISRAVPIKDYMASTEDNYEADREVWRKLYRQLIQENEELDSILEEKKNLYWNDDKGGR